MPHGAATPAPGVPFRNDLFFYRPENNTVAALIGFAWLFAGSIAIPFLSSRSAVLAVVVLVSLAAVVLLPIARPGDGCRRILRTEVLWAPEDESEGSDYSEGVPLVLDWAEGGAWALAKRNEPTRHLIESAVQTRECRAC